MNLQTHLQKKAQTSLKALGLLWIGFYEIQNAETRRLVHGELISPDNVAQSASEVILPIKFNGKLLGELEAKSDRKNFFDNANPTALTAPLEDLAAQVACLLNSKVRKKTLAIDSLVEEIANLHPGKYHWTGVYLLTDPQTLTLEAFRGEATPHMVIPTDRGICGAAVREGRTLNIADVSQDSRYLSCSIKTKSEIVLPIVKNGQVIGEIDIDSHVKNAFTAEDQRLLEKYCQRMVEIC